MRSTLKTVLSAVTANVYWVAYPYQTIPPDVYIIISTRSYDDLFGDNKPQEEQTTAYVDYYSRTDDATALEQIKTLMHGAGFVLNPGGEVPMYESDTGRFHTAFTWDYVGTE
jgi:hypothetical protein